uniref:BTB/POZ domain-containing protein n=1 Tax=Mesocestoides corti TaxID=53468 RepID=A0A5K3FQI0_MESCO
MALPMESGLKSKAGSSVIEFAFPKDAFLLKQHILFDTILAQVLPTCIGGTSTSGSDSECILMDTESSFSILDFVVFIENFLTSSHPEVTKSDVIDKVRELPRSNFLDFEQVPRNLRSHRHRVHSRPLSSL